MSWSLADSAAHPPIKVEDAGQAPRSERGRKPHVIDLSDLFQKAQKVLKANPNHDPKTGEFTTGAHADAGASHEERGPTAEISHAVLVENEGASDGFHGVVQNAVASMSPKIGELLTPNIKVSTFAEQPVKEGEIDLGYSAQAVGDTDGNQIRIFEHTRDGKLNQSPDGVVRHEMFHAVDQRLKISKDKIFLKAFKADKQAVLDHFDEDAPLGERVMKLYLSSYEKEAVAEIGAHLSGGASTGDLVKSLLPRSTKFMRNFLTEKGLI